MAKGKVSERIIYISMAVLFGVLLLIGTFFDEQIAKTLYSPGNVPATLVTTTGIYPFFTAIVFFLGAAFQRVTSSKMSMVVKVLWCVVIVAFALYVGFSGVKSLLDEDCLGGILPELSDNLIVRIMLCLVIVYPLFFVAYRLANRTDDPLLLRKIIGLVLVLLAVYVAMRVFKSLFNRPRYRTVAMGYEGVGFVPWYIPMPDPSELMAKYGLSKNEFSSFPSGHTMLATSTVYILYSLMWFFPKLKQKRLVLCVAAFAFVTIVMFTRMVLGAHYLSDVSAGALIGIVFLLIYNYVHRRIDKSKPPLLS